MISGNVVLFKDIKINLGLLITAWKMHALFRENRYLEVSKTANNLIRVCCRTIFFHPCYRRFDDVLIKVRLLQKLSS